MGEGRTDNVLKVRPRRLLFYDDALVYGGHEVMILNALEYLMESGVYKIAFVYSSRNFRLEDKLREIQNNYPDLLLMQWPYTTGRLQFLRTLWAIRPLRRLRILIKGFGPDCIIVGQGEISISALGVVAGVREAVYTVSYIPLAHTRHQRGERPFPRVKDAILWWYYRFPHRFITISDSMSSMLRVRGAKQPIDVVDNGINLSTLQIVDRTEARAKLALPRLGFVAALCGRIEFKQKGHDILLRALARRVRDFCDWTFLVVGDGPDRKRLETMIEKSGLGRCVKLAAWQQDMSLIYSAIDMLILPSRFEGMPVTMLEAMHYGLPIVASACDAMAELLPREWLFPAGDSEALADVMLRVRSEDNEYWLKRNKQLVATRFTQERQRREFARVLGQFIYVNPGPNES